MFKLPPLPFDAAALEPAVVAPGHMAPLRGEPAELRRQLEDAGDNRTGW